MPICKNDKKHTYKGTEPSPKGLGYCAHAEKVKTKRTGKDSNEWIVKKIKNGSKRWVKISNKDRLLPLLKKRYIGYDNDMDQLDEILSNSTKEIRNMVNERIVQTKKKRIEKFKIAGDQAVIGDPSYPLSKPGEGWQLNYVYKVEPGMWKGYFHSWITKERVNILVVTRLRYTYPSPSLKYRKGKGGLAVDSGQMSVVDLSKYPQAEWDDKWNKKVANITIKKIAGAIDGGYVSRTGWGDGIYNYLIGVKNNRVVQFVVFFMT
ncbi:hypothetical protein CL622_01480 [archaeon]|nr:hypothetical protein [archaeon]